MSHRWDRDEVILAIDDVLSGNKYLGKFHYGINYDGSDPYLVLPIRPGMMSKPGLGLLEGQKYPLIGYSIPYIFQCRCPWYCTHQGCPVGRSHYYKH